MEIIKNAEKLCESFTAKTFSSQRERMKRLKRSALYKALVDVETWVLIGVAILFVAGIIYGIMSEIDRIATLGLNTTHPVIVESIN